ncbi:multicopper oxidase domain-containing protein [Nitrosopumilus adriaticus]|uniref:multicopper oxidase domain-containing protein n=1 Tax=Nitrosopumilus adriaticus TaxID=1580092 RepID=UPI00352C2BDA
MKRKNKFAIGYGILAVALVAVFALPMSNVVPNEESAFEIKDMFNVFNIIPAQADDPTTHNIEMTTKVLPDGRMAYQMVSHVIVQSDDDGDSEDITSRYDDLPSIPGPTIIIEEGDEVFLTLNNELGDPDECVSVHVHGVHYAPESDGTLEEVNGVVDSCATVDTPRTFHWNAAKGSAGVWPYHDHTFGSELGAELEGLYGTLIVNPKKMEMLTDGKIKDIKIDKIDKDFVLWMQGTSFWGMEIDHNNDGKQTPLWLNPTLKAELGEKVRFNVIGIGSEFHTFHIHGHKWLQDGTTNVIDVQNIGPLTRTSIVIEAGEGVGPGNWMYHCHVFTHMEAGMKGIFEVTTDGAPSEPGPSPFDGIISFEIVDEPGPWFKNRAPIPGTSESLAVASPGDTLVFDMTTTNTVHTITSLIYPVDTAAGPDATNMPFDQTDAFKGGANVQLEDPGLYVFTCKVHPYMFAAVIVDDPATTAGLDFGENIRIVNGITVPTSSSLAIKLLTSFFVVTDPNNWQDYDAGLWNVSFPPVPVILDGGTVVSDLSALNVVDAPLTTATPQHDGIGEVWINTQFETSTGKTNYGSSTAVDTATWEVTKKVFGDAVNMNHPHNMWTNTENDIIYQTQWFDSRLSSIDRDTAVVLDDIFVGDSPSHVMTRPADGNTAYIAMNGENSDSSVVKVSLNPTTGALSSIGSLNIDEPHPHGHWMNNDIMVTPNAFTGTSSIYDFNTDTATVIPHTELFAVGNVFGVPIATGMHPAGDKYYVANLLDQTVTCVSTGGDACVDGASLVSTKPIVLVGGIDLITGTQSGAAGLLPIQTPVSPDGKYVVTATLLPSITIIDTASDELVLSLDCDAGCHGVNFGANENGGYNAYVSSKFSNALIVFDPEEAINADLDSDGILTSGEAAGVVGRVILSETNAAAGATFDGTPSGLHGMGGQGVLAIPNPYDGWIEETAALVDSGSLSPEVNGWITTMIANGQDDPYP